MASYFRGRLKASKPDDKSAGDPAAADGPERSKGSRKNLVGNARFLRGGRSGAAAASRASAAAAAGATNNGPSAAADADAGATAMPSAVEALKQFATRPGSVLDYYRIEEELGRGAFARVFRGIRKNSGREVAIKVVSLRAIADRAVADNLAKAQRLRRESKPVPVRSKSEIEAQATARVLAIMQSEIEVMRRILKIPGRKKKHIIDLHDVCVDDKRVALVVDLLSGGELFDRIVKKKRYTEKDAAFHFRRIMRALRVLHQHGIVHRDLKPENFVFEGPGENARVKITDFGLAMIQLQPDIHAASIVGSPGYIAPEVLERKEYSPACDVWSMGVILYILFVGGPPFHGKTDREVFKAIRRGKYRYPKDSRVSALGRDLVSKMLVLDPAHRISVLGVLNHPWVMQRAAQQDVVIAVGNLVNFNAGRKLKAVTTALTWGAKSGLRRDLYRALEGTDREGGFSGEELVSIRDALYKFKPSRTVARRQFVQTMRDLGFGTLPLDKVYELFDGAATDKADMVEILVGLSTAASDWNGSSQIRFCFDLYDRDGTGKVTVADMTKLFRVAASEMEASVAGRFASLLEAWRPTAPVSVDELGERAEAAGEDGLAAQLQEGALGAGAGAGRAGRQEEDGDEDEEELRGARVSDSEGDSDDDDADTAQQERRRQQQQRSVSENSRASATPESFVEGSPEGLGIVKPRGLLSRMLHRP